MSTSKVLSNIIRFDAMIDVQVFSSREFRTNAGRRGRAVQEARWRGIWPEFERLSFQVGVNFLNETANGYFSMGDNGTKEVYTLLKRVVLLGTVLCFFAKPLGFSS